MEQLVEAAFDVFGDVLGSVFENLIMTRTGRRVLVVGALAAGAAFLDFKHGETEVTQRINDSSARAPWQEGKMNFEVVPAKFRALPDYSLLVVSRDWKNAAESDSHCRNISTMEVEGGEGAAMHTQSDLDTFLSERKKAGRTDTLTTKESCRLVL